MFIFFRSGSRTLSGFETAFHLYFWEKKIITTQLVPWNWTQTSCVSFNGFLSIKLALRSNRGWHHTPQTPVVPLRGRFRLVLYGILSTRTTLFASFSGKRRTPPNELFKPQPQGQLHRVLGENHDSCETTHSYWKRTQTRRSQLRGVWGARSPRNQSSESEISVETSEIRPRLKKTDNSGRLDCLDRAWTELT
jgi:hypothetical protein